MLVYLVACAALMVYVAYLGSINLIEAHRANRERGMLVRSVASTSGFSKAFYQDPDGAYAELQDYEDDVSALRMGFARRIHFLPVLTRLFSDLPADVALQGLSASSTGKKVAFSLVHPPTNEERGNPVRKLLSVWNGNEELMKLVQSIRPITSERRMMGNRAVYYVQFECVLK
jgi:hypothetical protein